MIGFFIFYLMKKKIFVISYEFNSIIPLDKWKTNILTRIKKLIENSKTNFIDGGGIL